MTLMDRDDNILKSGRVLNYRQEIEEFLRGAQEEVKAVIEAGRSSYVMVDVLEGLGIDMTIAHPKEVKSIAKPKIKTGKRDSRILADLLRANLIPAVHKRAVETRRAQRILR